MQLPSLPIKRTKGPKRGPTQATAPPGSVAVQRWLPVQDLQGGLMLRGDGHGVLVLRIAPSAFHLLSDPEKGRRIMAAVEAFQGLARNAQLLVVPRPIDLDAYLQSLQDLLGSADASRRPLLAKYLAYVRSLVGSGETIEHRFYILLPAPVRDAEDLRRQAHELAEAFKRAEISAHVASDRENLDLLFVYLHPAQAAFERPQVPVLVTVTEGGSYADR